MVWGRSALELEAQNIALNSRPVQPGEFFGAYRIVRRIATGGMSFVYEAVRDDAEFHKRVAIKFLQQDCQDSAVVERFRCERQILAQLEHPHIARLLDGGTSPDGVPYLVMEYVDGMPIDRFVTENGLSLFERLRVPPGLRRSAIRTPLSGGPPGSQAWQYPRHRAGWRNPRYTEAVGFWNRQTADIPTGSAYHRTRPDAGICQPRASGWEKALRPRPMSTRWESCCLSFSRDIFHIEPAAPTRLGFCAPFARKSYPGAPGSLGLIEGDLQPILAKAREALTRDAGDSPDLLRELIGSYVALIGVTADASTANTGDPQSAARILQKAESLANALLRIDPASADSANVLSLYYRVRARYFSYYGPASAATESARRSLEFAERAVSAAPNTASLEELADSLMTVGSTAREASNDKSPEQLDQRLRKFSRAIEIWRDLTRRDPSRSDSWFRNIALCNKTLSSLLLERQDYHGALEAAMAAREIDQRFLDRSPSSPQARMDLAFDIGSIGWIYFRMKDYAKAIEAMRQNVALRQQVSEANPGDRRALDRLAYSLRDLAHAESSLGDRSAAARDYRRTFELYRRLAQTAPLIGPSLVRYAETAYDLGEMERTQGTAGKGCEWFARAEALFQQYKNSGGASPQFAEQLESADRAAAACRP